jgi:dGTPase
MTDVSSEISNERHRQWAATMEGFTGRDDEVTVAHADSSARVSSRESNKRGQLLTRELLDAARESVLAPEATRSFGAGNRAIDEEPDEFRSCFERDRDRILHSSSFRRLAGKTQVFIFPDDHQRTRLTHALEVAQVATSVARAVGLNVALTEAIAIGHDCGHGPGGHASEDALDPFVAGGFNHALWGAQVALSSLNLCRETLDGIANHSWSRPAPSTAEGELVSWADRIAYVCHDFEDALSAGIVTEDQLPPLVRERCGTRRSQQLGTFIRAMIHTINATGIVGMDAAHARALASFRSFNYDTIYLRRESTEQARAVISMLRALVEHFAAQPWLISDSAEHISDARDAAALHEAVAYVAGMTDRFACRTAVAQLGWPTDQLPQGIDR